MRFKQGENDKLRIISLGGFGRVTQNLFVYELANDILLVDCGIGFPLTESSKGDLLVPDIDYLRERRHKIRAMVLTHGHEDHYGGLPFVLPALGQNFPIFASRLTVALVKEKLAEYRVRANIKLIEGNERINLGPFSLEFARVSHSIPDTFALAITTPLGIIFHAADFKFDWTPVMGLQAEVGKIATIGNRRVICLLSDCLRSEKVGYTLSEAMVEDSLEREMRDCRGKVFITTMSSNVSRWQQAVNVSLKYGRKIALAGRSIEKIVEIASRLGYLKIPKKVLIKTSRVKHLPPERVTVFVAGSQAQSNSALTRISAGVYRAVKVEPGDKIVFSVDYIPGNEVAIHQLIDNLSRLGATVSYSDILDDLHVSGHAAQAELALMINLIRAKYLVPIGGAFRQMKQYSLLAQKMGYEEKRIFLPGTGETLELFPGGQLKIGPKIKIKSQLVDSRVKDK